MERKKSCSWREEAVPLFFPPLSFLQIWGPCLWRWQWTQHTEVGRDTTKFCLHLWVYEQLTSLQLRMRIFKKRGKHAVPFRKQMETWCCVSVGNLSRDIFWKWNYFMLHSACLRMPTTSRGCFSYYRLDRFWKMWITTNWEGETGALWRHSGCLFIYLLRLERNQFGYVSKRWGR